jgi:hypothetical protein
MMDRCSISSCPACRFSYAIRKAATTRSVLGALVIWLVFEAMIMGKPFGIAQLQEITGGPTILDMTFTTGPDSVYAVLAALGVAGRAFDLTHIVPLDLIFPFTYALFLALGISWGLSRLVPEGSLWHLLNLAPVLAAAADYCENAGIITLLLTYPARIDAATWLVSIMYVFKFAFSAVSFLTLLAALGGCAAMFLAHRFGRRPV